MLQIQSVSFSSYDRIFPEWFLALAQPRLELAPLPLQQSFPQRLMLLLLQESWTRLPLLLKFPPLERSLLHHFQFHPLLISLLEEAPFPFHQLVVKLLQDWPLFEQVQRQLETPPLVLDLHESLKFLFLQHEIPLLALLERQLKQVDEWLQFAL